MTFAALCVTFGGTLGEVEEPFVTLGGTLTDLWGTLDDVCGHPDIFVANFGVS